jgi:hypothetical protein
MHVAEPVLAEGRSGGWTVTSAAGFGMVNAGRFHRGRRFDLLALDDVRAVLTLQGGDILLLRSRVGRHSRLRR